MQMLVGVYVSVYFFQAKMGTFGVYYFAICFIFHQMGKSVLKLFFLFVEIQCIKRKSDEFFQTEHTSVQIKNQNFKSGASGSRV
jgi:hypothetical protein